MSISTYDKALRYLNTTIPNSAHKFPGQSGLDRIIFLLNLLDNPQNKVKVIHLAGTSGKGSTATYLSHLLSAHGFKVGLTISPHLFDIRERIQLNNKLTTKSSFLSLLNQLLPAINQTIDRGFGHPTYFEIITAMFYLYFYQQQVDYAVIETGIGGLLDSTNVVSNPNKLVIITRLGLDHTNILGNTISSIASQKAGIIQTNNTVLSVNQLPRAIKIINDIASKNQSPVFYLNPKTNITNIAIDNNNLTYDFSFKNLVFEKVKLNTVALYQVENSAMSLTALSLLSYRDHFSINPGKTLIALSNLHILGRFDIIKTATSTIIYDGAHNPQKLNAFIKSLKANYPDKKFTFVVAFKQIKDTKKMLKIIKPLAKKIIQLNFANPQNIPDTVKSLTSKPGYYAITGSLHLYRFLDII